MKERALQIVLAIVGLMFCSVTYFLVLFARQEPALAMMLSIYATLGVFLLLAVRHPARHRSLIAFTAWSSLAHATLMAFQVHQHFIAHSELYGVLMFFAIGIVLLLLAPKSQSSVPGN